MGVSLDQISQRPVQISGLYELRTQRALVDPEDVGEPVGQYLLPDRRVVVLAMFGAGLVFVGKTQRRVRRPC